MKKNIFNNKSFLLVNPNNCNYTLKKNGKIIYIQYLFYYEYLCILNKINFLSILFFPALESRNENDIIKKLIILNKIKKKI